jgi:hypothetical protein
MYKLYTDVDKKFSCKVDVGGVSLSECKSRMILETDGLNLVFNGIITKDGMCEVQLTKLKNILSENTKGKLKLEVIAENTLFTPWETECLVDVYRRLNISEIKLESDSDIIDDRPKVSVKLGEVSKPKKEITNESKYKVHIDLLKNEMKKRNITTMDHFNKLIESYKKVTRKSGVLSESDITYLKNKLIKEIK